jgi:hypothetical protein
VKFVVVNHEPPSREAACSTCAQPLRSCYVRHARTQRRYCNYDCYRRSEVVTPMMRWPMPGGTGTQAADNLAVAARNAIELFAILSAVSCWSSTIQMWTFARALTDAFLDARDLITMEGGDI